MGRGVAGNRAGSPLTPNVRLPMPTLEMRWMFKDTSIKAMTDNPQDRESAARQLVEGFGGKLLCYYFMLGEYDGVAIVEFPDNESAAATSMRVTSTGAFLRFETHALMSAAEAQRAMAKAKSAAVAYKPPGA